MLPRSRDFLGSRERREFRCARTHPVRWGVKKGEESRWLRQGVEIEVEVEVAVEGGERCDEKCWDKGSGRF